MSEFFLFRQYLPLEGELKREVMQFSISAEPPRKAFGPAYEDLEGKADKSSTPIFFYHYGKQTFECCSLFVNLQTFRMA